jgi:hypothetical protein
MIIMENINTQRIGGGTFFKLLLAGTVLTHILLVLIVMFGTLLGIFTPTEIDMPMPVWKSELFLLAYLFFGLFFMPLWAGIFWLSIYPGIWLYSKFKPMVLFYESVKNGDTNT